MWTKLKDNVIFLCKEIKRVDANANPCFVDWYYWLVIHAIIFSSNFWKIFSPDRNFTAQEMFTATTALTNTWQVFVTKYFDRVLFFQQTLKKRFFVLRSSPRKGKSRLEYFESEKKFRSKGPPKRVIYLASCLNIAKKEDSKHKLVFALYTREDVFGLIAESEDELNAWMKIMNIEKRKDEIFNASGKWFLWWQHSMESCN